MTFGVSHHHLGLGGSLDAVDAHFEHALAMQVREAVGHLETDGDVFVLVEGTRYLNLSREAVQGLACLHLQSTVDRQVGDVIEQATSTFRLLKRQQLVLDGSGVGYPQHEVVAARIRGGNRHELDVFLDVNLDGVLV